MPWELEVSDRLSRWGFAGMSYKPGIHPVVHSDALVEAVKNAPPGVTLYEVGEQLREPRFFSGRQDPTGTLEMSDLREGRIRREFRCKAKDCPAAPFESAEALSEHRKRYHRRKPRRKKKEKNS